MDKRVILAVAGSGKTRMIVESLDDTKRAIIVTYTLNNFKNLEERIISKFGHFPGNIRLYTYFTFLYSFCYKPFLHRRMDTTGINFEKPPSFTSRLPLKNLKRYLDKNRRLYHNRIAIFLQQTSTLESINSRLTKYFDYFCFDEVQDIAGHDFNLLKSLSKSEMSMLFVGDFFQHTYDTSRDGNVNSSLHKSYERFVDEFKKLGIAPDTTSLSRSYRCSNTVCSFVNHSLGIPISSAKQEDSDVVNVSEPEKAFDLFKSNQIIKLFYQAHYRYPCHSRNWGESKGIDSFADVCVVLNPTTVKALQSGDNVNLNPQTINKLYVACTRAHRNLYLVPELMYKDYKDN